MLVNSDFLKEGKKKKKKIVNELELICLPLELILFLQ